MWKHTGRNKGSDRFLDTSYPVEHLATFRVGPQFGVQWPEDGVKKLKDMERTSDVWAQKLILKLCRDYLVLEDENGEIVEKFHKNLIGEPHDYLPASGSSTTLGRNGGITQDNLVIFNVNEFARPATGFTDQGFPAEMHIFRCTRDVASDVATGIKIFLSGTNDLSSSTRNANTHHTSNGHQSRLIPVQIETTEQPGLKASSGGGSRWSHRSSRHHHQRSGVSRNGGISTGDYTPGRPPDNPTLGRRQTKSSTAVGLGSRRDDYFGPVSAEPVLSGHYRRTAETSSFADHRTSADGRLARSFSEYPIGSAFDSDVNTLNCYIDDVERFVARVQLVSSAQRELDAVLRQQREATLRSQQRFRRGYLPQPQPIDGNLQMRAQWPTESEFVDILTKFKYCFNILGKIQHQIYDPDAPQLARYLFSPLLILLDSARWALNKDLAPQITYPVLTPEANLLLQDHLSQREYELWLSLGDAWRNLPTHYNTRTLTRRPNTVFPTSYRTEQQSGTLPRGFSTNDIDRLRSQEEIEIEARQLAERERTLREKENMLEKIEQKLNYDKESLRDAFERISLDQPRSAGPEHFAAPSSSLATTHRSHSSQRGGPPSFLPTTENGVTLATVTPFQKQKVYVDKLKRKGAEKVAFITHDRVGQNNKELTVSKGDYVEVLNDSRNWWQCRDVNNVVGFIPNTILSLADLSQVEAPIRPESDFRRPMTEDLSRLQKPISVAVPPHNVPLLPTPSGMDPTNHFYHPRERQPNGRPHASDRSIFKNERY